jgi:hypothetical protein
MLFPLLGCSRQPRLPSDVVLRKATIASQELLSARFSANGTIATGSVPGSLETKIQLSGRLQDGGKQVDVALSFTGSVLASDDALFAGSARIVVAGEHDVYLLVHALDSQGMRTPLVFPVSMLNIWLRLPSSSASNPQNTLTPNPDLLAMQSAVVEVVNDRSFASLNGRTMYRYDVTINKQRLQEFLRKSADSASGAVTGENVLQRHQLFGSIWIDAETFAVHRVHWKSTPLEENEPSLDFIVDFSNHNVEDPIVPPGDAVTMEEGMLAVPLFLGIPLESPLQGTSAPSPSDELLDDLEYTDSGT